MATTQKVGRSREELLAAAAALTAAMHEVDDDAVAAKLALRAQQFESESWDAPPISAAGEITEERLLTAVTVLFGTGWASALSNAGMPSQIATSFGMRAAARLREDPLHREELLNAARHALAGRCSCGGPHPGHADHRPGEEQR